MYIMVYFLAQNVAENKQSKINKAAHIFSSYYIEKGKSLTTEFIKETFNQLFGCYDNQGIWLWKDAYEAVEIAQIISLLKEKDNKTTKEKLAHYKQILELTPTHTKRTQNQIELQQFSTPITIAFLAYLAAKIVG